MQLMNEIRTQLDKAIAGDDKSYTRFRLELVRSDNLGRWQFIDTLQYLCEQSKVSQSNKLMTCAPELLVDLCEFLSSCEGISEEQFPIDYFKELMIQASDNGHIGAQTGLLILNNNKNEKSCMSPEESTQYNAKYNIMNDKTSHDHFYMGIVYYYKTMPERFSDDQCDENAVSEFTHAAQKGHAFAMAYLGIMYTDKRAERELKSTEIRIQKSIQWFKKAAALGIAEALLQLGFLYIGQRRLNIENFITPSPDSTMDPILYDYYKTHKAATMVKDSYPEVYSVCKKAAQLGLRTAMNHLGWLHEDKLSILYPSDVERLQIAIEWYEKAVVLGDKESVERLELVYTDAAKLSEPSAAKKLADIYFNGRSIDRLPEKLQMEKAKYNYQLALQNYIKQKNKDKIHEVELCLAKTEEKLKRIEFQNTHLKKITALFFKNNWQYDKTSKEWKMVCELLPAHDISVNVCVALNKISEYSHVHTITVDNQEKIKLELVNKLIGFLTVKCKLKNVHVDAQGFFCIKIDHAIDDKSYKYINQLAIWYYQQSKEYYAEKNANDAKQLHEQFNKIKYEVSDLLKIIASYINECDPLIHSDVLTIIERAKHRSQNVAGVFKQLASKVVNLSQSIIPSLEKYKRRSGELENNINEYIKEYDKLIILSDEQYQTISVRINEIISGLHLCKEELVNLLSKLEREDCKDKKVKLMEAITEFERKFDNDEIEHDVARTPNQQANNTQQRSALETETYVTPTVKVEGQSNLITSSELTTEVTPLHPPAPRAAALEIVVHNPNFTPVFQTSTITSPGAAPRYHDNRNAFFNNTTHRIPVQEPSELTNCQLLEKMKEFCGLYRIQCQRYLQAEKNNDNTEMLKARYNISLNLLYICHGIWLIILSLDQKSVEPFRLVYDQLRTSVRDTRSILAKLPQDYITIDLLKSGEVIARDETFELIDKIININESITSSSTTLTVDSLKSNLISLTQIFRFTTLHQHYKKALTEQQKGLFTVTSLPKQKMIETAEYCLLQIGHAMQLLNQIAKQNHITQVVDLRQKADYAAEIKMLIIIIGKYAGILKERHSQSFEKIQLALTQTDNNYFEKLIKLSKNLRHPLKNINSQNDVIPIWNIFKIAVGEDGHKLAYHLVENPISYLVKRPAERAPCQVSVMCN